MESQLASDARERVREQTARAQAAAVSAAERRRKGDAAGARQQRRDAEALSKLQTLRYTNGVREIRASQRALQVGDLLKRDGQRWRVLSVAVDTERNVLVTLDSDP
jgi:hypothetical protein